MKKLMLTAVAVLWMFMSFAQDRKMSELKIGDLPKGVSEYCEKNLGGKPVRAGKIEEKGTTTYVAMIEVKGSKRGFLFDKDGKFIGKADPSASQVKNTGVKTAPVATPSGADKAAPKK